MDLKKITQQFFSAYARYDAEAMTALCTSDAKGRYVPYGRNSLAPIRGGIDAIWRALPRAVSGYRVEVLEMLLAEGDTVVVQTMMGGPLPGPDPLGLTKQGEDLSIPHVFILRFTTEGKISRLDAYWDNTVLNGIKSSAL